MPSSARSADPRSDRASPRERPRALLTVLADARAEAWRTGEVGHLVGAEAEGSPARTRDERDVGRLHADGLRYDGLRYTVAGVSATTATADRAVLRARLGTGAYRVVGDGRPVARPATPAVRIVVELRWTPDGWRVVDVR